MMPGDKDALFAKLSSTGEKSVREKLAQGVYGRDIIPLIQEWIRQREEERINDTISRTEATTVEQLRLTRSATRAAWTAAIAAIIAIIVTIIMAVMSLPTR